MRAFLFRLGGDGRGANDAGEGEQRRALWGDTFGTGFGTVRLFIFSGLGYFRCRRRFLFRVCRSRNVTAVTERLHGHVAQSRRRDVVRRRSAQGQVSSWLAVRPLGMSCRAMNLPRRAGTSIRRERRLRRQGTMPWCLRVTWHLWETEVSEGLTSGGPKIAGASSGTGAWRVKAPRGWKGRGRRNERGRGRSSNGMRSTWQSCEGFSRV